MTLFRRVVELLHERGADDVVVFGGGIIPERRHRPAGGAGRGEDLHPGRDDRLDRRLGPRARRRPAGLRSVRLRPGHSSDRQRRRARRGRGGAGSRWCSSVSRSTTCRWRAGRSAGAAARPTARPAPAGGRRPGPGRPRRSPRRGSRVRSVACPGTAKAGTPQATRSGAVHSWRARASTSTRHVAGPNAAQAAGRPRPARPPRVLAPRSDAGAEPGRTRTAAAATSPAATARRRRRTAGAAGPAGAGSPAARGRGPAWRPTTARAAAPPGARSGTSRRSAHGWSGVIAGVLEHRQRGHRAAAPSPSAHRPACRVAAHRPPGQQHRGRRGQRQRRPADVPARPAHRLLGVVAAARRPAGPAPAAAPR